MLLTVQHTPNPNSIRVFVGCEWLSFLWECKDEENAKKSPIAYKLWSLEGVEYLFFGKDFVILNKKDFISWDFLVPKVSLVLTEYLKDHKQVFLLDQKVYQSIIENSLKKADLDNLTELDRKIWDFLDEKIQPSLELHGGGVEFISFKDGVLVLRLTGACVGCPSAFETVQYGILQAIQMFFPEVEKVETI